MKPSFYLGYSDLGEVVGPRKLINNAGVSAAGGELYRLKPGVCHVNAEDTTFFPERWGTLINFRSAYDYGAVIFLSTSRKTLYHREYTLDPHDTKWYFDWNDTISSSDFRLENACKKFVAGYDPVTEAAYIQFHLGSKTYQLSMDHTKMTYGKTENGKWTTLWTK